MAYKITDACIACGACAGQCPVEAITEGDGIYVIDQEACAECGACGARDPAKLRKYRPHLCRNRRTAALDPSFGF